MYFPRIILLSLKTKISFNLYFCTLEVQLLLHTFFFSNKLYSRELYLYSLKFIQLRSVTPKKDENLLYKPSKKLATPPVMLAVRGTI